MKTICFSQRPKDEIFKRLGMLARENYNVGTFQLLTQDPPNMWKLLKAEAPQLVILDDPDGSYRGQMDWERLARKMGVSILFLPKDPPNIVEHGAVILTLDLDDVTDTPGVYVAHDEGRFVVTTLGPDFFKEKTDELDD